MTDGNDNFIKIPDVWEHSKGIKPFLTLIVILRENIKPTNKSEM
jgi:hypothetical protein